MRIALLTCLPDNNVTSYCMTPVAYVSNGEIVSLIGNQRVGILPQKIMGNSLRPIPSFDMMSEFPGSDIPVGGDTWPCFWRKKE